MLVSSYAADRVVVAAAAVLTAVLFTSSAADPVNVVKLSALTACAAVLLGLAMARAVRRRVLMLPWSVAAAAAVLLAGAFLVAAVTAPDTTTAILGSSGRNSGLAAYGSALVLFLISLRVFDRPGTGVIALAVLVAGLFTASYGALQLLGLDAINWNNDFNPVIATLGNPNFAAAYLGITAPVALWGALWTGWANGWRVAAGATAMLCLVVTVLSESAQGPLAAVAGLSVVALAVALDRPAGQRRLLLGGLALFGSAGLAGLVAGIFGVGPASAIFTDIGSQARVWYWQAALSMFGREPVTGVGLDSYGYFWRTEQPLEAVRQLGGPNYSDAAHSVPLQHLAQGGLLLGVTYALFVGAVALCLLLGLRRLAGQERLLLAGIGGAWVAYQVQSFVSIDQVPLLTVHFVTAAGVVVASGRSRLKELRLPGAPAPVQPMPITKSKRARAAAAPRERTPGPADAVLLSLVGVVVLALLWLSLLPLRASVAAREGDLNVGRGNGVAAVAAYDDALDLLPGAGIYSYKKAVAYNAGGLADEALQTFLATVERDPYDVASVRTAARLAELREDFELARELYVRGFELDPYNSAAILDLAIFDLKHSGAEEAKRLLQVKVRELPDDAGLWASYGDALAVTGDPTAARAAYERALALEPDQPTATAGLEKLAAQ